MQYFHHFHYTTSAGCRPRFYALYSVGKVLILYANHSLYLECICRFYISSNSVFGQSAILWYIADKEVIRYNELQRKVVGITATMLTKDLRELENDGLISRKQYSTIPPTVEYSLTEKGKTLIPALDTLYQWADDQMKAK